MYNVGASKRQLLGLRLKKVSGRLLRFRRKEVRAPGQRGVHTSVVRRIITDGVRHRDANLTVSSYSSYAQFLEKFAEKVLRAVGPWDRVKDWITKFGRQVKPDINYNLSTGEVNVSLGKGAGFDSTPLLPTFLPCRAN
jgi:hypothetical protein